MCVICAQERTVGRRHRKLENQDDGQPPPSLSVHESIEDHIEVLHERDYENFPLTIEDVNSLVSLLNFCSLYLRGSHGTTLSALAQIIREMQLSATQVEILAQKNEDGGGTTGKSDSLEEPAAPSQSEEGSRYQLPKALKKGANLASRASASRGSRVNDRQDEEQNVNALVQSKELLQFPRVAKKGAASGSFMEQWSTAWRPWMSGIALAHRQREGNWSWRTLVKNLVQSVLRSRQSKTTKNSNAAQPLHNLENRPSSSSQTNSAERLAGDAADPQQVEEVMPLMEEGLSPEPEAEPIGSSPAIAAAGQRRRRSILGSKSSNSAFTPKGSRSTRKRRNTLTKRKKSVKGNQGPRGRRATLQGTAGPMNAMEAEYAEAQRRPSMFTQLVRNAAMEKKRNEFEAIMQEKRRLTLTDIAEDGLVLTEAEGSVGSSENESSETDDEGTEREVASSGKPALQQLQLPTLEEGSDTESVSPTSSAAASPTRPQYRHELSPQSMPVARRTDDGDSESGGSQEEDPDDTGLSEQGSRGSGSPDLQLSPSGLFDLDDLSDEEQDGISGQKPVPFYNRRLKVTQTRFSLKRWSTCRPTDLGTEAWDETLALPRVYSKDMDILQGVHSPLAAQQEQEGSPHVAAKVDGSGPQRDGASACHEDLEFIMQRLNDASLPDAAVTAGHRCALRVLSTSALKHNRGLEGFHAILGVAATARREEACLKKWRLVCWGWEHTPLPLMQQQVRLTHGVQVIIMSFMSPWPPCKIGSNRVMVLQTSDDMQQRMIGDLQHSLMELSHLKSNPDARFIHKEISSTIVSCCSHPFPLVTSLMVVVG